MCDRLENLLQAIHPDSKVELGSLGKLYNSVNKEIEIPEPLLADLKQWNKARGQVIHQLVKISDVDAASWRERMAFARKTSREGKLILNDLRKFSDPKVKQFRNAKRERE
jgi:SRSO17 transposase